MKLNVLSPAVLAAAFASVAAVAAPLTETTAVHPKPDSASAPITYLKAGTEPRSAAGTVADTPAGWMAIEIPGPFTGFVEKKDLTKALDVKPGTSIKLAPRADAGVLAIAAKGDRTSITGVQGRWTQISLDKSIVGYIRVGGTPGYLPPVATAPAGGALPAGTGAAAAGDPTLVSPAPVTTAGQPVESNYGDNPSSLPRQFAGKFVSTRSKFRPRRQYDWELVDNAGKRYAYLDVSRLLLTEQIDKYTGHFVVVFGAAKPTADGKDLVIQIESLQLQLR